MGQLFQTIGRNPLGFAAVVGAVVVLFLIGRAIEMRRIKKSARIRRRDD